MQGLISSTEAASLLGIRPETLYAYVSRGLLSPTLRKGGKGSWFDPEVIAKFGSSRTKRRQRPSVTIQSEITLIDDHSIYYRGRELSALAESSTFEQVCSLLWDQPDLDWTPEKIARVPRDASLNARLRFAALSMATRERSVTSGSVFMATLLSALGADPEAPVANQVAHLLHAKPSTATVSDVEYAMILLADHGLAASTTSARLAAGMNTSLASAVEASLAVHSGTRHGAASAACFKAMQLDLQIESHSPGLGQIIYPRGDPRYVWIRNRLQSVYPSHQIVSYLEDVERVRAANGWDQPNVDMGLAAIASVHSLGSQAGQFIFAMGRIAGWIAHATEAADSPEPRYRAAYCGLPPHSAS